MTREHKLSLILGFAAVVFVGLLVSDHFSKARASKVNPELTSRTPEPATIQPDPGAVAAAPEPFGQPAPPVAAVPAPIEITMHQPENAPTEPTAAAGNSGGGTVLTSATQTPSPIPGFRVVTPGGVVTPSGPQVPSSGGLTSVPPSGPTISTGKETRHPVARGETPFSIAKKYYGDGQLAPKLLEYNKAKVPASGTLREGVTLRVPPKDVLLGKAQLAPESVTPGPATPMGGNGGSTVVSPAPRGNNPPAATPANSYTVVKGDTLGSIAQKTLGSSKRWKDILNLNRKTIDDPDALVVGTVLKLPARN